MGQKDLKYRTVDQSCSVQKICDENSG